MLALRTVNQHNWKDCIQLKPHPEQEKFVATNLYTLAEAQFLEGYVTRAIYLNETPIGFTMYGLDPDDGNYWVVRFMIDARFQGRGHGTAALLLIIDEIRRALGRTNVLMIGYRPDNEQARRLYAKIGFVEEGLAPWGEMVAKYTF